MKKKISILAVFFILISSSFFASATVLKQGNTSKLYAQETAELPEWNIGNFWKYDMEFVFSVNELINNVFSVNAKISDMYAILTDIIDYNDAETYILSLSGNISGVLSLFSININIANFKGDFGGQAYIEKDTLGIKKFEFTVDGEVNIPIIGWRNMYFEMNMDFVPIFDFFDFPINTQKPDWTVDIQNASVYAYVNIDAFGQTEYSSYMPFDTLMHVGGTQQIGKYQTILLHGSWGNPSNLWYAPDAGYLVKVEEKISWDDGYIESTFNLNLVDTNYDKTNLPPNTPDVPKGTTDCEVKKEYTYEAQTTDPNLDDIYYKFDWGDGTNSGWLGPYPSGTKISAAHKWYNKGAYNIRVKAKDAIGLESPWSNPLSILVKGDPFVDVTIHRIEKIDEIDWLSEPEWYYEVLIEQSVSPPRRFHNTDDGTYDGEWNSQANWQPDKKHSFKVKDKEVVIQIKLMDYDCFWEGELDDLADISGSDYPDTSGRKDSTEYKRGAIYHGTYNLVKNELNPYSPNHEDKSDFVYEENGYYITSGDYPPDSSTRYADGPVCDENDARVYFKLESDYKKPQATAEINEEDNMLRPSQQIRFSGKVIEGTPDYSWSWDFGDGTTSNIQNPTHIYQEAGAYNVKLTVTDGFGEKDTSIVYVNIQENHNPILTNDKVEWTGKGRLDDVFTFSVHYLDLDSDNPTVKNIVINGDAKTLQGSGSNSEYSLALKGSELGRGTHTFFFYFEDGYGGSAQTTEKSFRISREKTRSNMFYHIFENIFDMYPILQNLFKFLQYNFYL